MSDDLSDAERRELLDRQLGLVNDLIAPLLERMGIDLPPPEARAVNVTQVLIEPVAAAVSAATATVTTGGATDIPAPETTEDRYAALKTLLLVTLTPAGFVGTVATAIEGNEADGAVVAFATAVVIVILFMSGDLSRFADWVTERINRT
jgi:hypothetical protein